MSVVILTFSPNYIFSLFTYLVFVVCTSTFFLFLRLLLISLVKYFVTLFCQAGYWLSIEMGVAEWGRCWLNLWRIKMKDLVMDSVDFTFKDSFLILKMFCLLLGISLLFLSSCYFFSLSSCWCKLQRRQLMFLIFLLFFSWGIFFSSFFF